MATLPLIVPPPELLLDPPGSAPLLEKPINVRVGVVQFAGGGEVLVEDARVVGLFLYRSLGGAEEMWDETSRTWTAPPASIDDLAALKPLGLAPNPPPAPPPAPPVPPAWTGMIVAAGQKDASGDDRMVKATGGAPAYRVRAFASASRGTEQYAGLSDASPDLLFASAADAQRFAVALDPSPKAPVRAHMALKDASMAEVGYVEIRSAPGPVVEIANCDASGTPMAVITLSADGSIRLAPAAGRQIILDGPLYAGAIEYQPSGGGGRVLL